ncbi:response regulator [Algirhabdus cladophorae]|uniref:response regulator n=1 Tax=Algirhabdus cladophorae TaxID=3377108 RepID=UPI003B84AAD7
MQALILNSDPEIRKIHTLALLGHGFAVVSAANLEEAQDYSRVGAFDLVLMEERLEGRLTHTISLIAEQKKADVVTILVTERADEGLNELCELLPSLNCIVGPGVDKSLLLKLIDAECSYIKQRDVVQPEVQSDWIDVNLGNVLMNASLRTGVMPKSQTANYNGTWPHAAFAAARLDKLVSAQSALAMPT